MTQYLPRPREGSSSMWSTPASGGSCSPPGSLNSLKRSEFCHVCALMPTKIVSGKLSGDSLKRQVNNLPILSLEVALREGLVDGIIVGSWNWPSQQHSAKAEDGSCTKHIRRRRSWNKRLVASSSGNSCLESVFEG